MNPFRHEYAVQLECGKPDDPCCIFLPPQNPIEIFDSQQGPPTGEWRVVFLCFRHWQAYVHSAQGVSLEVYMLPQPQPIPPFWEIRVECAHENCGRPHTIYGAALPDLPTIVTRILRVNPIVPCEGHDLVWNKERIQGTQY